MTDFTFTETAQCELCGNYLSESDDSCDHDGFAVNKHIFRTVGEGRDSITGVKSTIRNKWNRLEEKVGDEWIEYEWIGTKEHTISLLKSSMWDSVKELPRKEMPTDR
jgi:hypothetical protein